MMKNAGQRNKTRHCPYRKYGPDGKLKKLCIDSLDELYQPDDVFHGFASGSGQCETCGTRTYGEANLCFIHLVNAMDNWEGGTGSNDPYLVMAVAARCLLRIDGWVAPNRTHSSIHDQGADISGRDAPGSFSRIAPPPPSSVGVLCHSIL